MAPKDRECTACGKPFRGETLKCRSCRRPERVCGCGKTFRGEMLTCQSCRRPERECAACGKVFRGRDRNCPPCRMPERVCGCGKAFRGLNLKCHGCCQTERECTACGKAFRGSTLKCRSCRTSERQCADCGSAFRSDHLKCRSCRTPERDCIHCGRAFTGNGSGSCPICRATERVCGCGRVHRSNGLKCRSCFLAGLDPEVRAAQNRSQHNTRRARKRAAEVSGPVPASVYVAIRSEGPCVFCGAPADTVEHITPLSRGGWEHPDNLVPACGSCNFSKGSKLLTEWDSGRVTHAVRVSPKVAAVYAAEMEKAS